MTEVSGVALFSTLQWPADALGERALLVIESYDPSVWRIDGIPTRDALEALRVRGFAPLERERWSFPYLEEHLLAIDESSGSLALIDEAADELFGYRLDAVPTQWYQHLQRERSCLVITGVDLHLATAGMEGVEQASAYGNAFGAMVLINDGRVFEGVAFQGCFGMSVVRRDLMLAVPVLRLPFCDDATLGPSLLRATARCERTDARSFSLRCAATSAGRSASGRKAKVPQHR